MKCDELMQVENPIEWGLYYDKDEVDTAIAELKARIQLDDDEMEGFLQLEEECGGGDLRNYIAELKAELAEKDKDIAYWREEYDKETQLTDALKDEIESLKASHYAESVDAGMRERSLRRALWLSRALRAEARKNYWYVRSCHEGDKDLWSIDGSAVRYIGCIKRTNYDWLLTWSKVESKCLAKAEEYK